MEKSDIFRKWGIFHKHYDAAGILNSFANHLEYSLSKDQYTATLRDGYLALALSARDRLVEQWIKTQQQYHAQDVKRIYYLSAEYLLGRSLVNNLINLGIYDETRQAMAKIDLDLADLIEQEPDAGLGNGGLGRLAACFLDSLATLELPATGYGIRYEFGIFEQVIRDLAQHERPDHWLQYGNPWEFERPEYSFTVRFGGRTRDACRPDGAPCIEWIDADEVIGVAYDTPIAGYDNITVNTLRLWSAKATKEFDLDYFQDGDYLKAVEQKNLSENISKVLYPNDTSSQGRELRLKQQYFFVSCSIQDIIRRYRAHHATFDAFPDRAAIQLNDTHPALAVAELMRLLVDEHRIEWQRAWDLTVRSCAYTNHTLLPEALETWPADLLGRLLPRHLEIISEIDRRFRAEAALRFPDDEQRIGRVAIVTNGPQRAVRMAHLAVVGSHATNGVSALHTRILRESVLHDFDALFPERISNKTNGITQRRWLLAANPRLAALVTERVGSGWVKDLALLRGIEPLAGDPGFREEFRRIKRGNKERLAAAAQALTGERIDPGSVYDVHVKRFHEYKRQLLNVLHVIHRWLRLKEEPGRDEAPRTYIFAGKAAPDYVSAKLVIRLINHVAAMLNDDRTTNELLRIVFLPNYGVSLAEIVMPAAEVSEQISTAGYEASGTGNMKMALGGAVTVGTLDGANIELRDEVGEENIFTFGLDSDEARALREGYDPRARLEDDPLLARTLELVGGGFFSPQNKDLFRPLVDALLSQDRYLVLADFASYRAVQERIDRAYLDRESWTRMAILNVARSGRFSSDRTIAEYNRDIWRARPLSIEREGINLAAKEPAFIDRD